MRARNLDALVIFGSDGYISFVGDAHVTSSLVIAEANDNAYLVHYPMERDEAAKAGLQRINKAANNPPGPHPAARQRPPG